MSTIWRFILFQLLIIVPFLSASVFRKQIRDPETLSKRLIRLNLVFIERGIAFWSIWGLRLDREMAFLPVSGFFLVILGMALGRAAVGALGLGQKSRASFLISSSLANHGFTMGAFLCYLILGERGLGLASLFLSYFLIFVFTVIFPYARSMSTRSPEGIGILRRYVLDLQNMPLLAVVAAVCLQIAGITRPVMDFPVDALMMISISGYYFSIGMNFTLRGLFSYAWENLALAIIKFVSIPAATWFLLSWINMDAGIKSVIMIQSFMPAAIYSVVSSVLFDLDTRLTTTLFVANTLIFLFVVLPLIFFFRTGILFI